MNLGVYRNVEESFQLIFLCKNEDGFKKLTNVFLKMYSNTVYIIDEDSLSLGVV